ncbi:TPA: EamA family transporter, partial [Streptococcus suis]
MKNSKIGTVITLVAGIAWGLSGVSGQYLMTRGVTVEMITTLRLVISGVVLLGVAYLTSRDQLMAVLK